MQSGRNLQPASLASPHPLPRRHQAARSPDTRVVPLRGPCRPRCRTRRGVIVYRDSLPRAASRYGGLGRSGLGHGATVGYCRPGQESDSWRRDPVHEVMEQRGANAARRPGPPRPTWLAARRRKAAPSKAPRPAPRWPTSCMRETSAGSQRGLRGAASRATARSSRRRYPTSWCNPLGNPRDASAALRRHE